MRCRLLTSIVLASAVLWCRGVALGQLFSDSFRDSTTPPKESPTPILDRLDKFGKRLFGGWHKDDPDAAANSSNSRSSARTSADNDPNSNRPTYRLYTPRGGSASGIVSRGDSDSYPPRRNVDAPAIRRDNDPPPPPQSIEPPVPRNEIPPPTPPAGGDQPMAGPTDAGTNRQTQGALSGPNGTVGRIANPSYKRPVSSGPLNDGKETPVADPPPEKTVPPVAGLAPIHERLEVFRQSFFADSGNEDAGRVAETTTSPAGTGKPDRAGESGTGGDVSRTDRQGSEVKSEAQSEVKSAPPSKDAVFSAQSAALSVETSGPRRIVVGKEGDYQVTVRNLGAVAAERVVVSIDLPPWAQVAGTDAVAGSVVSGQASAPMGEIRWLLPRLDARRSEKLLLRIVPRQSRPFALSAKVDSAPPPSQATIEVQEAKLALALHGPAEVLFGKAEPYKLEVSNTGTADAENVVVAFTSGTAREKLATAIQRFGALAAGQKKMVTMELVARHDGTLSIAIDARADGNVRATLAQAILVRRARLKVAVEGPRVIYSGNEATYRIRVTNQGNAPANNVSVQASLPRGAKYVSSVQNGRPAPAEGKVRWTIDRLNVGADAALAVTCLLSADGAGRIDVQCTADGDAQATASAVTRIETAANLVLTVDEPSGPVGLDGEATYQVRVANRGTASADAVEVVVYFAKNLEPVSAEGRRHTITPGQVVFDLLPTLAPGQTSTFQVKAKASKAGNHIYRVEVHSGASGIRLVREGTTRFYAPDATGDPPALAQPASRYSFGSSREARTADRRDQAAPQENSGSPGPSLK